MSKEIDLNEADSWDKEELLNNIKYLEDRGRIEEANQLREKAGLDPVTAEGAEDINVVLEQEKQVTSRFGTNDTPEFDNEDPSTQSRRVGRRRDTVGDVGPHGANADQFVPDDEEGDGERNTKNRKEADTEKRGRSANVAGGGGGGSKRQSKKEGEGE